MRRVELMLVATSVMNVLVLAGLATVVLALALIILGRDPVTWLAWSGVVLMLAALTARYVLARTLRPALKRISDESLTTIYMPLLNEGTEVWRPVEAMKVGELGYMVTENAPPDEQWAFQPGHVLRCEQRQLGGGVHLVPVAKAT